MSDNCIYTKLALGQEALFIALVSFPELTYAYIAGADARLV